MVADCSHCHDKFFIPLYFVMPLVCAVDVYRWVSVCNPSEEVEMLLLGLRETNKVL